MKGYTDYKHLTNNYNQSNYKSPSQNENVPTNFNLKTILPEHIDMAVFAEFNNRFKIGEKIMPVILLDAEVSSLKNQNYIQFDENKGFLNGPYFTMFRTKEQPLGRTNPSNKQIMYVVPKSKANGIVYEEYICEPPKRKIFYYEFKFITNYREYSNQMDVQFSDYFKNKRNQIICETERFVIAPEDQDTLSELEMINREDVALRTLYCLTYKLKLFCFTRDLSNMQKRERPNNYMLDISVTDSLGDTTTTSSVINIERLEFDTEKYPTHPENISEVDTDIQQNIQGPADPL
jgi:hypothetical protein